MLGLGRIRRFFRAQKVSQIHQAHRIGHQKDYKRIDEILKQFRNAGGLKHDYQAYKLFSLWKLLLVERPQRILELGSGASTAMFADYVRLFGGQLLSIDESGEWLANSKRLADIDTDDPRFTLRQADKQVLRKDGKPLEIGYDIRFDDGVFDLVLIDGPSLRVDGGRFKQAVNPNIFDIVDQAPPKLILVDIRKATVAAISQRLPGRYQCEISDVIQETIRPGYRYFTEFHIKS